MAEAKTPVAHRFLNINPVQDVFMYRDPLLYPDGFLADDIDTRQVNDTVGSGFRWVGIAGKGTAVFTYVANDDPDVPHVTRYYEYKIVHPLNHSVIDRLGDQGFEFVFGLDSGLIVLERWKQHGVDYGR